MPADDFDDDNDDLMGSDNDMDGENGQDGQEYVKKEFVARPYTSPYDTDKEVAGLTPANSR
ncbi:MAG: hypothetical protein ACK521_11120 [bacterium]